ncbi:MAG: xanthine dehydrogenase family protein molybdopterin-binding subunit [Deltaproteobacteria bacterium]|nr:xanthine dehydrogenase family protein molybdopterin-binding subunit [Deltaproteobacteria bacterium]
MAGDGEELEGVSGWLRSGVGRRNEQRDEKTGKPRNAALMDYKIPTSLDIPDKLEAHYVEPPQQDGPLGARGIGEHTMIPTPAAISDALYDACGIRILEMPITAEKVLRALKAAVSSKS